MEYGKGHVVLALFVCAVMAFAKDMSPREKCIAQRQVDFGLYGHQANYTFKEDCMKKSEEVESMTVPTEASTSISPPINTTTTTTQKSTGSSSTNDKIVPVTSTTEASTSASPTNSTITSSSLNPVKSTSTRPSTISPSTATPSTPISDGNSTTSEPGLNSTTTIPGSTTTASGNTTTSGSPTSTSEGASSWYWIIPVLLLLVVFVVLGIYIQRKAKKTGYLHSTKTSGDVVKTGGESA